MSDGTRQDKPHDLGGSPGYGPVPVDDDVLFHTDWERRAFGVTQLAQVISSFNTDAFRHGIEREDPATYLSAAYFEKWIRNGERMLVEGGVIGSDAISAAMRGQTGTADVVRTTDATKPLGRGSARPVDHPPRFEPGDRVKVSPTHGSGGHTRLPEYTRGKEGVVELINGSWIYPDTHAHGQGEEPTWVYSVKFSASELWPAETGPEGSVLDHSVLVDLFDPYLEAI